MNAPARIERDDAQPVGIEASISMHCPNQDEVAMSCRVDIARMRDLASIGAYRACDSAATLLQEVARVATQAVYAPIPTSQLIRIRCALSLTIEAARAMERAHADGR